MPCRGGQGWICGGGVLLRCLLHVRVPRRVHVACDSLLCVVPHDTAACSAVALRVTSPVANCVARCRFRSWACCTLLESAVAVCYTSHRCVLASCRLHAPWMLHVVRRMLCCLFHAVRCMPCRTLCVVTLHVACCVARCAVALLQDVWHKVVATDTLVGIALRYGITVDAIRRANHLQGVRRQTTSSAA